MATAQELLGIRIRAQDLEEQTLHVVKDYTRRKLKRAETSFQQVAREHRTYARPSGHDTGEVFRLFMRHYPDGESTLRAAFDTSRSARRLAWALCYLGGNPKVMIARSKPHLETALNVINHRWRWSSLYGIFDALLRSWYSLDTRSVFQEYIGQKLSEYSGSRPRLIHLKENRAWYLRSDGPVKLATHMLTEALPITKIWDVTRLPAHAHGYSYIAEVLAAYTRSAMRKREYRSHIKPALLMLADHNNRHTYKRCLSRIILRLDRDEPTDLRENVLQVAFQHIGDTAHAPEWQPWPGASESEQDDLRKARETLNNWIAQRFITAFFDKVAMDRDRRLFWLQYTPYITRFKVLGDAETRYKLRNDDRIGQYVDARFSRISGSMSALLMQIKDRVIVEFGQTGGACYVHRKGDPRCPSFDKKYGHIRELRIGTSFPLLMRTSGGRYYNVESQGRFIHNPPDGWGQKLNWWMRRELGIEV